MWKKTQKILYTFILWLTQIIPWTHLKNDEGRHTSQGGNPSEVLTWKWDVQGWLISKQAEAGDNVGRKACFAWLATFFLYTFIYTDEPRSDLAHLQITCSWPELSSRRRENLGHWDPASLAMTGSFWVWGETFLRDFPPSASATLAKLFLSNTLSFSNGMHG